MWCFVSLLAALLLCIPVHSTDSVYGQASHFWPLDSITGIKDVIINRKASIYGNDGVSLKGKGNGFLEIDSAKAALNLGEYSDACLIESKNCKNGMTITFWIRIKESVPNGKVIDLFSIKGSHFVNIIKVKLINKKDSSIEYSGSLGNFNYNTTTNITLGEWVHSSLVLTKSGSISLFLNGRKTTISHVKESPLSRNAEKVLIMVGQWIVLREFGTAYGPVVDYDEIAIFYHELNHAAIRNIILKNFGQIKLQKECLSNGTSLIVKWQPPFDTYGHLVNYTIVATSSGVVKTVEASKHANEATLRGLHLNTRYNIKVVAKTSVQFLVNSTVPLHCTTSLKINSEKGKDGLSVAGIDVDKIRVIWRIPKDLKEHPIAYGVSYGSVNAPGNYKVIYERLSLNYTIAKLRPDTRYYVTVTVYTKESGRFKEETEYAKTKRKIYLPTSPVRNLSIGDINWNSAELRWLPPHNYSEPTAVYKLQCKSNSHNIVYETSQTAARLGNLLENTKYDCSVLAGAKDIGYFEEGINAKFRTLVRFPAPAGINITILQWNMTQISWHPIKRVESIVYEIAFYSQSSPGLIHSIQATQAHVILKNLKQETGYFFTLRSGNGTIFGEHISRKRFFATPDRNECLDGTHSCKMREICMNKKGSFECHCIQGYLRDGNICKPMSISEPKCGKEITRNIEWSETQNCQTAHSRCPKGTDGIAHRFCKRVNSTSARWMNADLSDCVSIWLDRFAYQLKSKEKNSSELMSSLKSEYRKQDDVVGGDVRNIVTFIGDIVDMTETSNAKTREENLIDIAQNLVSLTDDLLSLKTKATWSDLPKEKQTRSAGGILKNVESMARLYSSSSNKTALLIESKNAVMGVRRLNKRSHLNFESTDSRISIPHSAAKSNDAVYYGAFNSIENFLGTELGHANGDEKSLPGNRISNVVAATLFPKSSKHLKEPVVITHKFAKRDHSEVPHCVFWNFSSSRKGGQWSTNGCQLHSNNDTHIVCHCFHLTNFAVLMSVTKAPLEMKQTHEDTISLITKICIGVSLVALIISFATFCSIRFANPERNTTHKHLVAALFFAQLLFLFGIDKTSNLLVCRGIAIGLHYLFLVAFTLMGMEGFILYTMLIKVYKRNGGIGFKKLLLACWAIPMIIVGVTAGVDLKAYANQKYCWINHSRGFIWSFVGPVIFVIVFNSVIFGLAVNIMKRKSKRRDLLNEEIWYWIKCLSMLITILGLAWLLGVFYVDQRSIAVAYVFSIVNASQGLAIFVFLCVLDQRIQEAYCRLFCCSTRGHFNPNTSRSGSATKSTMPTRQRKEQLRLSKVSMEDQEIMVHFSEDKIDDV